MVQGGLYNSLIRALRILGLDAAVADADAQGRLTQFAIPEPFHAMVERSWREREPSLYGRFDLAWDGKYVDFDKKVKEWTDEEAEYQIDAIQNYIRGKMVKSEYWIGQLIDTMHEAKKAGVDEATMKKAKEMQYDATLMWEWWTAENSDGFHNPTLARESLTKSVDESMAGIKIIDDALKARSASAK